MSYMKRGPFPRAGLFLVLFSIVLWGGAPAHSQNAPTDIGSFSILSGQRQIGTEKFKITTAASGLEATGEIQVDIPGAPRTSETCSLKTDGKLQPVSYERQQRAPKKGNITAEFSPSQTKLASKTETGTEDRIFYLPDNHLVVLDTNFFHHYAILLRQYDGSQPSPQHFNVFIPQEAVPGTITLNLVGKENQTVGKTARELNHFQAATEEVKIDIWATPQAEIYRISIPQANLEVVRQ